MGVFAISKWSYYFSSAFGFFLFCLNFRVVFTDLAENIAWWHIVLLLIYVSLLLKIILDPVGDLKELTKEEIDDMALNNLDIDDDVKVEGDKDDDFKRIK